MTRTQQQPFDAAAEREARIVERMGKCVHFTGIQNDTCKAGVSYESVRVEHEPINGARFSRPCIAKFNAAGVTCASRCPHTREQSEAREVEAEASFERATKAIVAIREHSKATGQFSAIIDCPACGTPNSLGYGIARSNGHIHARCNTPKCVAFMQ